MPASPTRLLGTFVALLAAGALVACGDSDDSSTTTSSAAAPAATTTTSAQAPAGAGTRLALVAEESGGLSFDRRALSAKAGDVTIAFDNPQGNSLPHAVEIEGNGVERDRHDPAGCDEQRVGDRDPAPTPSTARSAITAPRAWRAR